MAGDVMSGKKYDRIRGENEALRDRIEALESALRERMAAEDPLGLDDDWAPVRALLTSTPKEETDET